MSLLGGTSVLGVDLTDAYANKPRPNDVCELRPDSASGAPRLVARFRQWHWSTDQRGNLRDPDTVLAEIRSSLSSMIDGPQGLASIGNHMRQCERECSAPGRTPDRIDDNNIRRPFMKYIKSSVGLFQWLRGEGLEVSPSHFKGGVSEVFPGDIWRRLSGSRPLHKKNTNLGHIERKAILEAFGVVGLPDLPTHDQNDACVGALLAAASVGWVPGVEVKGIGAPLMVDENSVLREGQMVVPELTIEKQNDVLEALDAVGAPPKPDTGGIDRPPPNRRGGNPNNDPLYPHYLDNANRLLALLVHCVNSGYPTVVNYLIGYEEIFGLRVQRFSQAYVNQAINVASQTTPTYLEGLGNVKLDTFIVNKHTGTPGDRHWNDVDYDEEQWLTIFEDAWKVNER